MKKIVFSGMRPTGKLHLGHLVGALDNWIQLQKTHACIFSIVDWHALMGEYENSKGIRENVIDMVIDWMACGIDPEQSTLFVQSDVPEHLELQMVLSCLTPLGWLERNPTYKEQLREITTRDLQTYAFLGYPVLQAADILLYKATAVPIGEDQLPHLELCREIARRFNFLYKKEVFKDCEAILTPTPRLPGLDGRKMSKSYQNTINLSDSPEEIKAKVQGMLSDPKRLRKSDLGNPEECNVHRYFDAFAPLELKKQIDDDCSKALKGCFDAKKILTEVLVKKLEPIREKRRELESQKDKVNEILRAGADKARGIAQKTMAEVREVIF
jgi:tryptophanyl-tRNA synthetase